MGDEIGKEQGELLEASKLVRVATVTSQGDPYIVPVRFHFDGEALYFVSPEGSQQLFHIKANRRIALEADRARGEGLGGIVVQGLAQFPRGKAEQERVFDALQDRYPNQRFDGTLVKVVPLRVHDLIGDNL